MYKTIEEVFNKSKEAIGETFGSYDVNNRLDTDSNKGNLGQIIEEGLFGYAINSNSEADFLEFDLELKVTAYKRNKNGTISAKERLVLSIIDYMEAYKYKLEESPFWKKNSKLLLMLYEYQSELKKRDMRISHSFIYKYPIEDLKIIKDDYNYIINKIKIGEAHLLSEADTMYLGACTKGSSKSSLRHQPFSNELAMQRAFSLKNSYMTIILRDYIFGTKKSEQVIKDINILENTSFEKYVISQLKKYYNQSLDDLMNTFDLTSSCKNLNEMVISRMLGCEGRISYTEEFLKAGIKVKTIRYNKSKNSIVESMSFPTFKFKDLVNEEWEESNLREMFISTKWLFAIYTYDENGSLYFDNAFFWTMPLDDLEKEMRVVWEKTKKVLLEGVILSKEKNRIKNNLPSSKENRVGHVRPHASKASYEPENSNADELPDGRWMTKQSFWLNNSYIVNQINKYENKFHE